MTQSQLFPNIGGILLETKEQSRLNQTEILCDSKKKKTLIKVNISEQVVEKTYHVY